MASPLQNRGEEDNQQELLDLKVIEEQIFEGNID